MSKRRIGIVIALVAMIPFSGLMFMMLGPVIVPSSGTLGASAACPPGYVGAYVKTWRSFDGRNSSDHWELECTMPDGTTVPADDGASYGVLFATAAGTVAVLGAIVGAMMIGMTRRERREAARAREEEEELAAMPPDPAAVRASLEREAAELERQIKGLVDALARAPMGSDGIQRGIADREARLAEVRAKLRVQAYPRG